MGNGGQEAHGPQNGFGELFQPGVQSREQVEDAIYLSEQNRQGNALGRIQRGTAGKQVPSDDVQAGEQYCSGKIPPTGGYMGLLCRNQAPRSIHSRNSSRMGRDQTSVIW